MVVLPRRGMYVAEVTLAELRELEEVRLELESLSTRLAVERMTAAQLSEMHTLLQELSVDESRPDNHEDGADLDRRLHDLVWSRSVQVTPRRGVQEDVRPLTTHLVPLHRQA